jgi:hypothetical protein
VARLTQHDLPLIGWKELVALPSLHLGQLEAKIDTGARSAALHASDISIRGRRVRFAVPISGRRHWQDEPLIGQRSVRSSSGHSELRAVIEATIVIGKHSFRTEVTLTDRTDMGVPMLLGRSSIKGHFLVHPGRSYIVSKKKPRP